MHSPPDEPANPVAAEPAPEPTTAPTTEPAPEPAPAQDGGAADLGGAPTRGGQEQPTATGALPPDPPNYKAVARISTQAALESIQLAFTHADLLRETQLPADWAAAARTTSNASADFDRDRLRLVVYCGFVAIWSPELQADGPVPTARDAPFELHARFRLDYALKDLAGIEDGDEVYFAWTNGMLHAWPYWREIAQSTTLRMGLPPLLAGTFKIPWSGDPGRKAKNVDGAKTEAVADGEAVIDVTSVDVNADQAPDATGSE